jgi:hypothetical protein
MMIAWADHWPFSRDPARGGGGRGVRAAIRRWHAERALAVVLTLVYGIDDGRAGSA